MSFEEQPLLLVPLIVVVVVAYDFSKMAAIRWLRGRSQTQKGA